MFNEKRCTFYAKITLWVILTLLFFTVFTAFSHAEASPENVEVTGADQNAEEVLSELQNSGGAVLFASEKTPEISSRSLAKDTVVLSYSRKIYYEDFFTRNYRVKYDGKTMVAYCVQPKVLPPSEGSVTATEYNNKLMTKALYYSYGYPGYDKKMRQYVSKRDIDEDYEDDDGAYALSHLVLSYFYDKQSINSDAFLGVSSETKKTVIKIADLIENTWPAVPDDSRLSFNKTSVKAEWDKKSQRQKTPVLKLTGHEDNKINVTIPKFTTMVKTSGGVTKSYYRGEDNSLKVKVFGGDSFYFTAPDTVKGTFKSPEMKGSLSDFQPYLIKVQDKQDIVFCGAGDTDSVSFSIKWQDVGQFELNKVSANEAITSGNPCYSLEGAKYEIYDNNGKVYETIYTDGSGKAHVKLPYGKYTVREASPSCGYALDNTAYELIVDGASEEMDVSEKPQVDTPELLIQKKDKESMAGPQGGATLEGAEYIVEYYSGYYDEDTDFSKIEAKRSWTVKTDSEGKIKLLKKYFKKSDEPFTDSDGNVVLPLGTVKIREIKAPEGYLIDETPFVIQITPVETGEITGTYKTPEQHEQIIRGDLKFIKQAEGEDGFLEGIVFRITSKTTGESCQMITDKNGLASTQNGIWMGTGEKYDGAKGALPYDTYVVDEIRNDKNFGLQLIENIEVIIDQNQTVVDLGILVDKKIRIETRAADKNSGNKNIIPSRKSEITDTVSYSGLEHGHEYVLKGRLIEKESGKIISEDGIFVEGKTEFKAVKDKGEVDVNFTFDSTDYKGKAIVIYEYLYEEGELIASHEDLDSISQTISVDSPDTPSTGDNIPIMMILLIFIVSVMGIFAVLRRE